MKTVFMTLASLLVTASAFAMPAVGDHALYNVTISQGGQSANGTLETTITALNNGQYNVESKVNIGGQSQVQNDQKAASDLLSDAVLAQVMSNCAQYGGKMESVTVAAGTFNACALPAQDQGSTGFTWVAQVAFGIVKYDVTDANGQTTHAELQSFQFGK